MKDYCLIALAYNEEVRIYASVTTKLASKSQEIHQTLPTASAAMGRFLTASAMMSLMYKDGERLTLKIDGDGPIGTMLVEAKDGIVKSTIENPNVYLTYNTGKLNVGKAVGNGFLYITKDWKQKYFTSSTPLQTGEIGDDFTYYYASSEQTPSAVGLGVLVGKENKVLLSGGFIIQLMPHASEETIQHLERIIKENVSVTNILKENNTPEYLLNILSDGTHKILESRELKYRCYFRKSKYRKSLLGLDIDTLDTLLKEDKQVEIVCPYCGKKYIFNEKELIELINEKTSKQ